MNFTSNFQFSLISFLFHFSCLINFKLFSFPKTLLHNQISADDQDVLRHVYLCSVTWKQWCLFVYDAGIKLQLLLYYYYCTCSEGKGRRDGAARLQRPSSSKNAAVYGCLATNHLRICTTSAW